MISNFDNPNEFLYRAIKPLEDFWKEDGKSVTSAAFFDSHGLSVDRQGDNRSPQDATLSLHVRNGFAHHGIASVTVQNCHDVEAILKYLPTDDNIYHSEIHNSDTKATLTKSQRKYLARHAIINLPTQQ